VEKTRIIGTLGDEKFGDILSRFDRRLVCDGETSTQTEVVEQSILAVLHWVHQQEAQLSSTERVTLVSLNTSLSHSRLFELGVSPY